ncbi:MAG TPA: M6 family metalloprotease domain-containing protein [Candidatus Eisenbacteria bacterium]
MLVVSLLAPAAVRPSGATVPVPVAPSTVAARAAMGGGVGPDRSFRLPTSATSDDPFHYKLLVLLVEFRDVRQSTGDDRLTPAVVYDRIFGDRAGTLASYWKEASHGRLVLEGTVSNWVRVDSTYAYYCSEGSGNTGSGVDQLAYPHNVPRLVEESVQRLGTGAAWPEYDVNADGVVDGLLVIHAGPGLEEAGEMPTDRRLVFLAHQFHTKTEIPVPGARVFDYAFVSADAGIGVAAHEFGHLLGLSDLYDTGIFAGALGPFGAGDWSLMATGALVNDATMPTGLDAYSRMKLAFDLPDTIRVGAPPLARLFPQGDHSIVLLPAGRNPRESFLVEARGKSGLDAAQPGEGLLIWHVDEKRPGNLGPNHYRVALEQADGLDELGRPTGDRGDAGDAWPPPTRFAHDTRPGSGNHDDEPSWVVIDRMERGAQGMSATLDIAPPATLRLQSYEVAELVGDGDGRIEPGETGEFRFVVCNDGTVDDAPGTASLRILAGPDGPGAGSDSVMIPAARAGECVSPVAPLRFTLPLTAPEVSVDEAFLDIRGVSGADFFTPVVLAPPVGQHLSANPDEPPWLPPVPGAWRVDTTRFRTAPASWRLGPTSGTRYSANLDASYESPLLGVPTINPRLEIWSAIDAETLSIGRAFDGGRLEIRVPPGDWQPLTPAGGWSHELEEGSGNALDGQPVTSGHDAAFHRLVFDLAPWAGRAMNVRFRFASDPITVTDQSQTGWWLDDLELTAGDPPPDLFAESTGDSVTVEWTTTIPNGWHVYRRPDVHRGAREPIAEVPPSTANGNVTHRVIDHPPAGTWIYSVRPLDDDGPLLEYDAEPVTIDIPRGTPSFAVTPNPWRLDAAPLTVEYVIGNDAASAETVRVRMFDVAGRLVATLVNAGAESGHHEFRWPEGNAAPVPGVYFVRLDAPGTEPMTARLVIVR